MNDGRWTIEGGCYDYRPLSILLLNIKCGLYPLISSLRFNMMMMIFVVLLSSVIRHLAYMMGISNNNERANHLWAFNEIVIIFWSNHIVLHIVINWQPAIRCTFSTHFRLIIGKNAAIKLKLQWIMNGFWKRIYINRQSIVMKGLRQISQQMR